MKTTVYYGTSVKVKGTKLYEPVIHEVEIAATYHAEPFTVNGGDEDEITLESGWYSGNPESVIGRGVMTRSFNGPHASEAKAVAAAVKTAQSYGWIESREAAEAAANKEAGDRIADKKERQSLTKETAETALVAAGIFKSGWHFSKRNWAEGKTKIRVQAALHGDKCAAGCLRRDCVKS